MAQLEGYVRDTKGNPIKDAAIVRLGKTDETGHFLLRYDFLKYWKAILFIAPGFKPKPVLFDLANPKFDVVMEPEVEMETFKFPGCSALVPKEFRRIGKYLRLTIPKAYKFKSGYDVDYQYFLIGVGKDSERQWMRGGLGPMYAGVYPSPEEILGLSSYSYRKTSTGSDWSGITKDGRYWRYMGSVSFFETYGYKTDSKSALDAFDAILDSACFQAPVD